MNKIVILLLLATFVLAAVVIQTEAQRARGLGFYPPFPGGGGRFCRCRRFRCRYYEYYAGRCYGGGFFGRRRIRCCRRGGPYPGPYDPYDPYGPFGRGGGRGGPF